MVNRNNEQELQRKSFITFNRGGKWQSLAPPTTSSTGKKINCRLENGCSLHLHSLTSDRYPYPYSVKNAVGIIVGIGNVGKFLKYDDNKLNTFISRDGGLNWFEVWILLRLWHAPSLVWTILLGWAMSWWLVGSLVLGGGLDCGLLLMVCIHSVAVHGGFGGPTGGGGFFGQQ